MFGTVPPKKALKGLVGRLQEKSTPRHYPLSDRHQPGGPRVGYRSQFALLALAKIGS